MSVHYQPKEDGLYWVKVKYWNTQTGLLIRYDWALGVVRTGHFSWHNHLNSISIPPISLRDLIASKTEMVKIEKPEIKYNEPINFDI